MKSLTALVLALLSLPGLALADFTDNGNGAVTDRTTNLMWQKCSQGQEYNPTNNDCGGNEPPAATAAWEAAIGYCEILTLGGFADWRLPNVKELSSLVDDSKDTQPLINDYFPDTQPSDYWSSTTYATNPNTYAWGVNFGSGFAIGASKANVNIYVRCVRGQ